ncbi:MAG TPA: D-alanyl-D-alanine carboxypeptidase/D-alanyl-D-alanine-endopeptidase [Gaiellaceae bacterium]|jgi:D-alanyl-D-alanine carboxypeptidase/D-alanyl-D-alanine-endopeptidase (penicillin-binding protein 4)|nr:D-alanyl-D-alanine carboxypeptidase/D-alanyl-D-alanine-endopeptidase [Gaiellaceae bacterium]
MTRRRLPVVALVALVLAAPAGAGSPPLAKRLARALAVPHVARGQTAAIAFDLQTGKTLFAEHDTLSLAPASNEKLVITYAALVGLGRTFRIETDVLGRGQQSGSVWQGHLLLVGHGDPTLSSADLAQLASQVRAAGITRVTGAVFGDETFFDARRTAPGWKPWFYVNESPPLSALTVDRGSYRGRISRNPALSAALLFRDALRRAGVTVGGAGIGDEHGNEVPLAAVDSAPLSEIVRYMDKRSDNFTAELVLKQLGAIENGVGTSPGGAAYARRLLAEAGVPLTGVRLVDGSGLSLLDRLTVRALEATLRAAWADPDVRPAFLAALPVAGINGTLSDRMRRPPARGNVIAKTGTTFGASALSGYVKRRYAFSVLQNGNPVSSFWARRAQDRFAIALAAE